ncbi:CopG family transcriptional regulator [Geminocystis sp. GBBB08]|uniref:CopG family transcriptional regulator n=1 Tax=Geminocystis sp. GBBB08 TaxID=2604140 RepID=UPI0027E2AE79|nr:CopG family transcriptional regulator [Geminocystis sp. GBBB08]
MSVSISEDLVVFIDSYKNSKGSKSSSQVVEEALMLLREQDLENAYREADKEIECDWEVVAGDGLGDETW